jgi:antitoxin ParD1/3/4
MTDTILYVERMNVSLTPELERFVARKVESGRYQTASEVVREGLRLLEERDLRKRGFLVESLDELKEKVQEGIAAVERGEYGSATAEDIMAEGRKRLRGNSRNG